jgi:hypothetical protein
MHQPPFLLGQAEQVLDHGTTKGHAQHPLGGSSTALVMKYFTSPLWRSTATTRRTRIPPQPHIERYHPNRSPPVAGSTRSRFQP